jgi:hypothetical protein
MYKPIISILVFCAMLQPALAEDSTERWETMQDRMAYEDMIERQREKAQYDQMEREGLRNTQNRIIQPPTCTTVPVTTSGGMIYMQTICKP